MTGAAVVAGTALAAAAGTGAAPAATGLDRGHDRGRTAAGGAIGDPDPALTTVIAVGPGPDRVIAAGPDRATAVEVLRERVENTILIDLFYRSR
jgi:hypothetical protein